MDLFYEIGPLIGFGLNLFLAFLVLRQNLRKPLNQTFALFLLCMAFLAFSVYGLRGSSSPAAALPWEKATFAILPLVAVSFYRFVYLLGGSKSPTWRSGVGYALILVSIALAPTSLLVKGVKEMWYGGVGFQAGILLVPYMVVNYGLLVLALAQLFKDYRRQRSITEKSRYVYILTGAIIFTVGLSIDALANQGVPIYPLGIFSNIMFSILCGYAILKYQLLDIPIIIRRGTTYILVSALGIGVYMGLLLLAYAFVSGVWGLPLWANIFFILIFAIALQPLLRWVQNAVDRVFFRGRYDYLNALERMAEETKTITDLHFIAESLVSTVKRAMQSLNVSVLLPDTEGRNYTSVSGKNDSTQRPISLDRNSILVWWLSHNKGYLSHQDLEVMPQFKALTAQESRLLHTLDAELFMPLITREGLRGILIVGKKLSQLEYNAEEIRLLGVVASQMATAFENARLFELQTRRYREQALLARLSMTIASELDFNRVYDSFMKEIQEIMPADYSSLIILNDLGSQISAHLEYRRWPELKVPDFAELLFAQKLPQGDGLINEPEVSRMSDSLFRQALVNAGLNSILVLPLASKSHGIGYLALASQREDIYNEDQIRLLKQVAVQLAIAYEKSRLYEMERKARLELEKQDKERTEFINSLIHEIKTPITAMLASSDLLSEELSSNPGVLSELAGNLDTSIGNLNRRVSELTDFAKLQNTEIKIKLESVDMRELIQRAESLVSNLLQSRDQTMNSDLSAECNQVFADPDRVIQILLNLITNASKYGKSYKSIDLRTYNRDKFLVTEIKDTSQPILVEASEELFSPYHLARRKESGGLGLGLFICKRLVELHGGKIWLESEPEGNHWNFSLPLATEKEAG
jgi:two-component system clock-associated histidine kinase SasA